MSILKKATTGTLPKAQVYTIYGPNGVGKTTLASRFPNPVMFDLEDGSQSVGHKDFLRIAKKEIPGLDEYMLALNDIWKDPADRKTLITDSVEALESLIHKSLCKEQGVESIEDIPYGRGNVYAREKMEAIMRLYHRIRDDRGLTVILVGHSIVKSFTDPKANQTYDRYIMRANDKFASIIRDLSDGVFFVNHKVITEKGQNPAKAKAFSTGDRVIHTVWSHAYDAKSRYALPAEINFSLVSVEKAVSELIPKSGEDLVHQINQLKSRVADQDLVQKIDKAITEAGKDDEKLKVIKSRLMELTQTL
ncbi:MAG: ATP-binding protein [Bdellovibrionaceae bacterium]|nr:ATP-binding protein [Pseudobdellovibrionaceae bacterium]